MRVADFGRFALSTCVATAFLADCGGSQPPIGAPQATLQTSTIATHAQRGKSWMLPDARSKDLLYVSSSLPSGKGEVYIFTYPEGKFVDALAGFNYPAGLCTDSSGDVFVTSSDFVSESTIYEYPRGGKQPIQTLDDPGAANGCSVDPSTGNLAVANLPSSGSQATVAVYQGAQGSPTLYAYSKFTGFLYCAYDPSGDLFADSYPEGALAELPAGEKHLQGVSLDKNIGPMSLQWVNGYLVIAGEDGNPKGPATLYQVYITGTTGRVTGPTLLNNPHDKEPGLVQYWVHGKTVIGPDFGNSFSKNRVEFWHYPKGGNPTTSLKTRGAKFYGVAVSEAE